MIIHCRISPHPGSLQGLILSIRLLNPSVIYLPIKTKLKGRDYNSKRPAARRQASAAVSDTVLKAVFALGTC